MPTPVPARWCSASSTAGASGANTADNAIATAQDAGLAPADGALAACSAAGERALCRAARRADGQFRGRPHQYRRRPRRHAGSAAHRRRRSPRASSPRMPALQRIHRASSKASGGTAHCMGLLSPGGVHSHQGQIAALARILAEAGIPVAVHAFLDGRDTPPKSALGYLQEVRARTSPVRRAHHDRHGRRALLRDGSRQALGPGREGLSGAVEGAGDTRRRSDRRGRGRLCGAARPTSSCCRPRSAAIAACATATACCSPISAPTGCARSPPRCSIRISRASRATRRVAFAAALGLVEYSAELNRFLGDVVPAAKTSSDTFGEVVARRRADAAAHRRDREIRACHVLLQRRSRDRVSRRGAHPGAVAQGRDLRPAARDVGAGGDRQGGRGDRGRPLRRHRAELRQYRHGRAYRASRCRGRGGRDGRSLPRPAGAGGRGTPAAPSSSPPTTAMPR